MKLDEKKTNKSVESKTVNKKAIKLDMSATSKKKSNPAVKILVYTLCILLAVLSILPFLIMVVNATRSTTEIQQHAISLIPSKHLLDNFKILTGKSFNPLRGFFELYDYINRCNNMYCILFNTYCICACGI
ncbi:MAG: hypothetical protein ACLR1E_05755 [Coprococcus sp.]